MGIGRTVLNICRASLKNADRLEIATQMPASWIALETVKAVYRLICLCPRRIGQRRLGIWLR